MSRRTLSHCEATKLAILRALNHELSVEELIANRDEIKHDLRDWSRAPALQAVLAGRVCGSNST